MLEKISPFFQSEITLPVFPLVLILICAALAALAEIAGHYYFHPGLRRELSKLACYVYGSLAWVIPLCIIFAVFGNWQYIPIAFVLLGAAGTATWWANHHDDAETARARAEDGEKLLAESERLNGGRKGIEHGPDAEHRHDPHG